MGRRSHYSFSKQEKELKKRKKAQEKAARKLQKKQDAAATEGLGEYSEETPGPPADAAEQETERPNAAAEVSQAPQRAD